MSEDYGLGITTQLTFEQAVTRTRIALRSQGFGILSELAPPPEPGSRGRTHLFMGLWERATSTGNLGGPGLDVGDHLACSVVVFEEIGTTTVAALDPSEGLDGWEPSGMSVEARTALEKVLGLIETFDDPRDTPSP